MHRTGKVRRPYIRGCARAAIEIYVADGRRRHIGPRVVRRIVRVLKGDAIPGCREITILETAEPRLGLSVANAVRALADGARRRLRNIAEVRHRRSELANVLTRDLRAWRCHIKQRLDCCQLRGQRGIAFGLDGNFLGNRGHCQRE